MAISLKPHNEKAYQNIKEILHASNKVAVIHPTGTGKMYIALKFLEENSAKRALYVAPTNSILHQVKKSIFSEGMDMSDFPKLQRITYQKLMSLTEDQIASLHPDIIVLDEFHHCGASEWGKGVNRLLESNPNVTVLGLSATPLRYFDGLRDMSNELFENNVASEITLDEAIEQGILPEATYISSFYSYEENVQNMQSNIDQIKDEERKKQAQELLQELRKKLDENTKNLPELFAQHMKNKNGKYIIFCRNIQDMQDKMSQARSMFSSVNSNISIRGVSSNLRQSYKILSAFENDSDEHSLKLLYAVNMLNEGYHINDLDGVIMMRPTYSPAIFTQQLGRALSIGSSKAPVIFDLVNNFDTCRIIENFAENMRQYERSAGKNVGQKNSKSRLAIFDNTKDFRDIAEKITQLSQRRENSIDAKIDIFEKFAKTGEELTGSTTFEGFPIGKWAIRLRFSIKNGTTLSEEQLDRLNALGILDRQIDSTIDEKIDYVVEWIQKYPKARILGKCPEDILKEYATSPEEYLNLVKKYETVKKYYRYISVQNSKDKLSKEQFSRCKEGNVGGTFGYSAKIEQQAVKYGQDPKNIYYIISSYGSIENFTNLFFNQKLNEEDMQLGSSLIKTVFDIDLNFNNGYDELYCAIMCKGEDNTSLSLYSSNKLKETLKTLIPNQITVLEKRFGLLDFESPKTYKTISREMNLSKERIRQIENHALWKLRVPTVMKEYCYDLENPFISEEGKRIITNLKDTICRSNILFDNTSGLNKKYSIDNEDMLKAIQLVKSFNGQKTQLDSLPINNLGFSVKTSNCLRDARIYTLHDLSQLTSEQLMRIRNLGKGTLNEITEKMAEYGLTLKEESELSIDSLNDDVSINRLHFSTRTYNCLNMAKIYTLHDLSELTAEQLMHIRNLGKKSFDEITAKLANYGITLKDKNELSMNSSDDNAISINKLHFSTRTYNCLDRVGICTLHDLSQLSAEQLKQIRNLGNKSFGEITAKLAEYGLTLKNNDSSQEIGNGDIPEDIDSQIESAKAKKYELQEVATQLQEQLRNAEELLASYDRVIDEDAKDDTSKVD